MDVGMGFGDQEQPLIRKDLFSPEASRQLGVLSSLSMLTADEVRDADLQCAARIVELTGSANEEVRASAAECLESGFPCDAASVPQLVEMMQAPADGDEHYYCATLLGRMASVSQAGLGPQSAAVTEGLAALFRPDVSLAAQERAAWAIGRIGQPAGRVMPLLRDVAESAPPRLRRLIVEALESIRGFAA